DGAALRAALSRVTASRPIDGVVSLWGLGAAGLSDAPGAVQALLTLAEALAASPSPARLTVVTQPDAVAQRALVEATGALRERLPGLRAGAVILGGESPSDEVAALAEELIAGADERGVWLRGRSRQASRAERVGRAPGPEERLVSLGDGAATLRPEGEGWSLWAQPPSAPADGELALRVVSLAPLGERAVVSGVLASSGEAVVGVLDGLALGRVSAPASALRPAACSPAAVLGAWLAERAVSALAWGPESPGVVLGVRAPAGQALIQRAEAAGVKVWTDDDAPPPDAAPRWLVNVGPGPIPEGWRRALRPGATIVGLGGDAPAEGPFTTLRVHPASLTPGPSFADAAASTLTLTTTSRPATAPGARRADEVTLGDAPLALAPGDPTLGGPWWVTASTAALQAEAEAALVGLGGALAPSAADAQARLHVEGGGDPLAVVAARLAALTETPAARLVALTLGEDTPGDAAAAGLLEAVVEACGGWALRGLEPSSRAQAALRGALRCLDAPSGLRLRDPLKARPDEPAWSFWAPPAPPPRRGLAAAIAALPDDEALALLCDRLRHHLSGLSRGGAVDLDAPIASLGVDSLTAMELLSTLHAELGVRLPMSALLEATSARALAVPLLQTIRAPHGA
ncbi:acyl carrier protein, partial [Myxococcota bacterium]|nr:acyl carrier protein [Myxococcota bacterium]